MERLLARLPQSPRIKTRRRRTERRADIEGSTQTPAGDAGYRGEVGLRELRASVRD